jgi:hypothetical protein
MDLLEEMVYYMYLSNYYETRLERAKFSAKSFAKELAYYFYLINYIWFIPGLQDGLIFKPKITNLGKFWSAFEW